MKGWTKIYTPLVKEIERMGGTIDQLKEKFGGLRLYWTPAEDAPASWVAVMHHAINGAEQDSLSTCIVCGKTAHLYTDGWVLPLCDEHAGDDRDKTKARKPTLYTKAYELTDEELKDEQ